MFLESVWRYPVKSMVGEPMRSAETAPAGMVGDRGWAVRDGVGGGIRGAKKIGQLMRLAACYEDPSAGAVSITLPDGATVSSSDPDVNRLLSSALDHEVTLWPLQPANDLDHYRRGVPRRRHRR